MSFSIPIACKFITHSNLIRIPRRLRKTIKDSILILVVISILSTSFGSAVLTTEASMERIQSPVEESSRDNEFVTGGTVSNQPIDPEVNLQFVPDHNLNGSETSEITVKQSSPEGPHPWVNFENFVTDCIEDTVLLGIAGICNASWTIYNDSGFTLSDWAGYDLALVADPETTPVYYSSITQICRSGMFNKVRSCSNQPLEKGEVFKAQHYVSIPPWERVEMSKTIYWSLDPDYWWIHDRSARSSCSEKDGFSDSRECGFQTGVAAQGSAADPVNTHSGAFDYSVEDFSVQTIATPLSFLRTYSSAFGRSSALGYGWTHNHDSYLIFPDDPYGEQGVVWFKAHSSNEYAFMDHGDGTYSPTSGVLGTLTRDPGPPITYTITTDRQETYLFDENGRLLRWADSEGHSFEYTYDDDLLIQVKGPDGIRTITFDYNNDDLLESVRDHTDRVVSFQYDTGGDLIASTDVLGYEWQYSYDVDHHLIEVTNPLGIPHLTATYDEKGRVLTQRNGADELQAGITYHEDDTTEIINARGYSYIHTHDERNTLSSEINALGGSIIKSYDANFRPMSVTDENSNTSSLQWSEDGANLTQIIDPAGFQTNMSYDPLNNLIELMDGRGNSTTYTYDGSLLTSITDSLGNTSNFTYTTAADSPQPAGLLKTIQDPLLHETRFTYNPAGDLIEKVDALGNTWTYQYNDLGWITEATDPHGVLTIYIYDDAGRIVEVMENYVQGKGIAEEGKYNILTQYVYDEVGNLEMVLDTYGKVDLFQYDTANRLIRITKNYYPPVSPDSEFNVSTEFRYDLAGNQIAIIDPIGTITRTYFDALDRPITVVQNLTGWELEDSSPPPFDPDYPDQNVPSYYNYDSVGNLISVQDALGTESHTCYNERSLPVKSITNPTIGDPCFSYTGSSDPAYDIMYTWSYDAVGNLLSSVDPLGSTTAYSYDDLNRLETVTNPLGFVTTYGYDALGNLTSMMDAEGVVTRYQYDAISQLTDVIQNDRAGFDGDHEINVTTSYVYDNVGNLTVVRDANDGEWDYFYDGLNRLTVKTNPMGGITGYTLDGLGNLTGQIDPNMNIIHYSYDLMDRLVGIDYADPDPDVSFTYDAVGNLISMVDGLGTTIWDYDGLYRPISIDDPFSRTIGYSHNAIGNRIGMTYADGKMVSYGYDPAQRLIQIQDWDGGTTSYSYDKAGQLIQAILPNGVESTFTWDAASRLEGLTHTLNTHPLATYEYSYDRLGNRTQAVDYLQKPHMESDLPYKVYLPIISAATGQGVPETTIDYTYDPLYRLTAADYSSGEFFHYTYDAAGNRLSQATQEGSTSYTYDAQHRITKVNGVEYSWDPAGNLLNDGERTFAYDHADRLTSVEDGSSTYSFAYDGLGNRYQQSIDGIPTTYSLDIAAGLTQVLGDGTESYVYGLGRIGENGVGGWQYPLADALGSARQLTDPSGSLTLTQSFEPFGAPLNSYGDGSSDFGFTGEQDGIADLIFLRARYYDPGTGRFITKDRFPGFSTLPSTQHPYQYALCNPINLVDPSGQNPLLILAALGFVAGFGIDTWMQYQANGGWCGYNPLSALGSGLAFSFMSVMAAMTLIQGVALLGMGVQGLGVMISNASLFGAGMSLSAAGTAAMTWLMTGQRSWPRTSIAKSISTLKESISSGSGNPRASFYVRPNGDVIPSTGYRYIKSDAGYLSKLLDTGVVPPNTKGTYFSFNNYLTPTEASSRLQVPHDASIKLKFDTLQIIDDIQIPYGNWGNASYLEPLTKDFPAFGSGGATQAITRSSIKIMEIVDLRTGDILNAFP